MLTKRIKQYLKNFRWELGQEQIENMLIAQQIIDTNTKSFERYKNMYQGEKVAVVATGPTLAQYVPEGDIIYVGVNKAYKSDKLKLDYLFCQDYLNGTPREIMDEIGKLDCIKFYGKFKSPKDIQIPESLIVEHGANPYYVDDCPPTLKIYEDICHHPLMNCFSVAFSALQFAIFTNPAELYLIGCDCSSTGYFYDKSKSTSIMDKHLHDMYEGYVRFKEFATKMYPDTRIISINPVGLKGIFEDRYIKEKK
ncbi:MAG: hypothetical protein PUB52_10250 [Lachnospiraceae bacterium]|nr:hypothetical protein [Lachnospiraceae bacterium]